MKKLIFISLLFLSFESYSQVFHLQVDTLGIIALDTTKQSVSYQKAGYYLKDDVTNRRLTVYFNDFDSTYFDYIDYTTISAIPNDKIYLMHAINDRKDSLNISVQMGRNSSLYGNHDGVIQLLFPAKVFIFYFNYMR